MHHIPLVDLPSEAGHETTFFRQPPPVRPHGWTQAFTDDAPAATAARLGGKGLGLVRMAQHGLPVPAGYCIPAEAFEHFLRSQRIDLHRAWTSTDPAQVRQLAQRICDAELPEDLRHDIVRAWRALHCDAVAVRSSAVDEDHADHSFAGQHQTFLCVRGETELLDRVKACWASLLQPAALAYRQAREAPGSPAMAVVVQVMVPADVAGVGFAQHPVSGDRRQMLVEACHGLGEGLVASRVSCDSFTLDRDTLAITRRSLQYKPTALRWNAHSGQIEEQPVAPALREPATLSDPQLEAVGQVLQRVSSLFGGPQDIEWAYAGGQLHLLQCRPITVAAPPAAPATTPHQGTPRPEVERGTLWSRMDIGEIFTGRMTPLGISFAKHYQYKVHRDCGTSIGLLDLGEPDEYMGYLKGHVYLNVAYTAYLMAQSPPGFDQRPFVQRFSSEEVDVSRYVNPYGERHAHPRHSRARTSAFWAWATVKELLGARRRARQMVASRHAEYDRAQGRPLRPLDLTGLREEMTHALDYFKAMHTGYLPFYINAFGLYGLLEELCKAWLPGVGQHLQNRLKGDMSNLRTVESARDLWALTQSLERYPLARKLVLELPAHQLAQALQDSDEGRNFCRQELDRFMRENGVRAREEMELSHPRWVDDPTYVFQMIKAFLAQGYEVENRLAGHAAGQAGQADTEALLRQLGWPKRLVVRRVIALYSGCSRLREDTRMAMITSIWLVRRVLVEVSRRLVAEGVLRDEAELNWLDFQDLITYLNGYASAQALFPRQKIEAGRRRYQSWLDEDEPPLTFIGHAHARATSHPLADDHAALMGLGTSRGCVRARARVIHDLAAQAGELQKGEVIVTRFTDASWTPLFALAAGIVTDIGSMLSHSSIVAREFGIPSVVNTQTATQRIRTGDWLQIDGESGNVQLLGHGEA